MNLKSLVDFQLMDLFVLIDRKFIAGYLRRTESQGRHRFLLPLSQVGEIVLLRRRNGTVRRLLYQ